MKRVKHLKMQMKRYLVEYKRLKKEIESILEGYPRQMERLGLMFAEKELDVADVEKLCSLFLYDETNPITVGEKTLADCIFKELEKQDIDDDEGVVYMYMPCLKLYAFNRTTKLPITFPPECDKKAFVCVYDESKN